MPVPLVVTVTEILTMAAPKKRTEKPVVGVVGLGIMGGSYAKHLLAAGFAVVGCDIAKGPVAEFRKRGGRAVASPAAVIRAAEIVFTSLPSIAAMEGAYFGRDGLASGARKGRILIETSTMPLETKFHVRDGMAKRGVTVLDCPVSGTGAQAAVKDLIVYASGDEAAYARCKGALDAIGRGHRLIGPYGDGSKLKFVANLLVTIHNVSAAEALVLGLKSGLDGRTMLEALTDGAGNNRMLQVRGPMMLADDYRGATMKMDVYQKDIDVIGAFADALRCPVPLFSASKAIYASGLAEGRDKQDTAAVAGVLRRMAGLKTRAVRKG
jgi:3-hydroxyisobutyrate dehydrogenase-like beta-hydroxyacid dehydrogenase